MINITLPVSDYNITVHASLPVGPHLTHSPATITCRAVLDGVMEDGLTMHMTWSKEDRLIADADCHHEVVPRPLAPEVGNADEGHMEFVSNMTMRELKPHDNGTYGCSAALVSYSTGQRVSMEVNSSTLMSIVGEFDRPGDSCGYHGYSKQCIHSCGCHGHSEQCGLC